MATSVDKYEKYARFGYPPAPSLIKSLEDTKVDYVKLGSSGLSVSWPILGAMSMGDASLVSWILNEDQATEVLKAAFDSGINTIDTANTYSNGMSETIIGRAIKKLEISRQKVVIMTKCYNAVGEEPDVIANAYPRAFHESKDYINQIGLSRAAIFSAVEGSLARLGTTYIDVLQIHRYDDTTPPEETMRALHDLVQAGKVRYIGASSMWATQFAQLQFIAEKNGWTKFVSMQDCYNLCYREEEREMIRFCKNTGVGITPWAPLHGGKLARPLGYDKSLRSQRPSGRDGAITPADEKIIKRVEEVAKKRGWEMSHVALAWHKSKGTVPIVGLNSVEKVKDICEMRGKDLTEEEVKYLEEPYVPRAIVGHT